MKCPNCQFDNPDDKKFCRECGAKLLLACPQCAAEILPSDKFCGECGHKISIPLEAPPKDLSFDEKLTKIQRYLPKGLTEKILSQKDRIEGERKQVTVMFADMERFSQLSEKLGPEETYTTMDQVYEILIHKVHEYEGTVNEFTGDGIMALFGAPVALEDAPQRAIRSAYAIHREMTKFSDKMKQEKENIPALKMRIGIHTGPVVVGTLGNDLRVEFKAVGDTVNLASRVEGLAEPGTTYLTEDTFKLIEGFFRFEALRKKEVKGREEPIRVYRVIAPSTRRTRFDVSAERGLTPFVARERELALLLDGFERSKRGRGQAFSITGDAGVGKSRLLYEFRKAVSNENITFLEGKCLSYSRGVAYHPVIDILKSNFDIHDGDSEVREKVKKGLKILGADEASTLPYLLELLSVKDSGIDEIPMSPEGRKDRIIEALKRIVLKGSEIRPLIMAFEDLHWMDTSSEDVLKRLLDSIPGARVLLVFTYRPEFVHTWGGKSFHSQVTLNRLSNRESLVMVSHLLGTEELDKDLEEFILEKTEGVPFFIEEFTKSLKDLKIIEREDNRYRLAKDIQQVAIPSTIQDVIMARVDSLTEGAKELIQIGSVIEREFGYALIKRATGLPEPELLSHLSVSKDSELVYERGIYPETTYIFKHALTREVVYDSILTNRKKRLHEEIGNALEELYKDNIDKYYGVLADHYMAGENHEKGAEYSRLAAQSAEKAGSFNDAIVYAKKTVASLERLPLTDDVQKKIIDARTALGLYMTRMNYYSEAKEAVDPIADLVLKSGPQKTLSQILAIKGTYEYSVEEDVAKAFDHLEKSVTICEEIKDIASLCFASWRLGLGLSLNCEYEKTVYHYGKALDIHVAENNLWGISVTKSYLSYFGYFPLGRIDLAYQASEEAIRIAEESGDIYSKAMAHIAHGASWFGRGFLKEATEHLLKGVDLCERIDLLMWNAIARWELGNVYHEIGEYQNAKEHYSKAAWLAERSGALPSWVTTIKTGVARAKVMMNEKDTDLESLYRYVYENRLKNQEGFKQKFIGEILLNMDDQHLSEAQDWIKKAIETHKRDGMMRFLGWDYTLYAELFKRKDDSSKAKENLGNAIEIYRECSADGWLSKTEKELAALS